MTPIDMTLPRVISRNEWLVARKALLTKEKELTRHRDSVTADRRRLPMVRIHKEYDFDGPAGKASLRDLVEGLAVLLRFRGVTCAVLAPLQSHRRNAMSSRSAR
jgi:predicted dithiol-disulfide oxidoreductase (DUF899 family)